MILSKNTKIKFNTTGQIWTVKQKRGEGYFFKVGNTLSWHDSDWIKYMINTNKAQLHDPLADEWKEACMTDEEIEDWNNYNKNK